MNFLIAVSGGQVFLPVFHYRITVTFNVNSSIPPNFEEEVDQGGQQKAEEEVSQNKWLPIRTELKLISYHLKTLSLFLFPV